MSVVNLAWHNAWHVWRVFHSASINNGQTCLGTGVEAPIQKAMDI